MKKKINLVDLFKGDRRTLAKAITLVESDHPAHFQETLELLQQLPPKHHTWRLAVSGTPGVGKSTFIESFGLYLLQKGHRVAVLSIDPTSPLTGGSILGDKTRMEKLSQSPAAFIRPSPSNGHLGGTHRRTKETELILEAAGYDVIIVETVGVGQSEFQAHSLCDCFIFLAQPASGDELQGMKKGILELIDMALINKCDGDLTTQGLLAKSYLESAFHAKTSAMPFIHAISSLKSEGLDDIYKHLEHFFSQTKEREERRKSQNLLQLKQNLDELFLKQFHESDFYTDIITHYRHEQALLYAYKSLALLHPTKKE